MNLFIISTMLEAGIKAELAGHTPEVGIGEGIEVVPVGIAEGQKQDSLVDIEAAFVAVHTVAAYMAVIGQDTADVKGILLSPR